MGTPELSPNGQRFRVVELEGWTINPGAVVARGKPGLSVSVLDSACAWREVARFDSGNYRHTGYGNPGREAIFRRIHDLAAERAAELNLLCRADEAA